MALDFQQIYARIKAIGEGTRVHQERLDRSRQHARSFLDANAGRLEELRAKVERARQYDPNLRCALPLKESLDAHFPAPALPSRATLIAADGSQVNPDRHASVQYSLVNVGVIIMELGSGKPPEVFTYSDLKFGEELYSETGMVTEESLAMDRDLAERIKLLELAPDYPEPILALTDGPVELWGVKDGSAGDYRRKLETHKAVLSQLQARGIIVGGLVDKPGADLVIRLLEIAGLPDEELKDVRSKHGLRGVTDRWLYGGSKILMPGERSAIFGLQSSSRAYYTGGLALHFFYLNVGDDKQPVLVRVEFPKWVADDQEMFNLLHAALVQQCQVMGARPYPYILHRAHEIAVVKFEDKRQVEQMLDLELRRAGGEVEPGSNKQSAKDLPGKNRKR